MPTPAASPIPAGFHSLTPHLVCKNALAAMDFYVKAFDGVEEMRLLTPDGQLMHGCIRIGDAPLMIGDECPQYSVVGPLTLKGSPVLIHLYVPDVDATMAKAEAAGATVTMPPQEMFWGDRYGQLVDPFGHLWSVATCKYDMTAEETVQAARDFPCQPAT